jgi:hypothetical protein
VRHPLLYPLLRNESAACLRASPPKHRRVESGDASRREEQSQMLSALARALQAVNIPCLSVQCLRSLLTCTALVQEKEVNRLKDRLYEAQQQLEIWRAKAMATIPTPPPTLEPAAIGNPVEPPRHARSYQPAARPRPGIMSNRAVSLSEVTEGLSGAMEN